MDEVAGAIADPVRREILEMLRADGRLSAGRIAERFAISRPAVSRHLRVLRESGLVRDELVGRQRFYALDASRLTPLARWLAAFLDAGANTTDTDIAATDAGTATTGPIDAGVAATGLFATGAVAAGPTAAGPTAAEPIEAGPIDAGTADAEPVGAGTGGGETGQAGTGGGDRDVAGRPGGWAHHLDALETEVYRTRRERRADEPKENTA